MRAVQCPSCGAPVEFEEMSPLARCPFCGSTLAPTSTVPIGRQPVVIDLRKASPAGRRALKLVLAILVAVAVGSGLLVWFAIRTAGRAIDASLESVVPTTPRRDGPLALADLATLGERRAWLPIAASPPPGPLSALDPVAALPWAVTVAQAWSPDATLTRIDVERLRPDGTVNVADDAEASLGFRFLSPERIAEYDRRAELSSRVESDFELLLVLEGGVLRGLGMTGAIRSLVERKGPAGAPGGGLRLPAFPRSLPMTELVARARRGGHPAAPFLKGYLIHLPEEGWVWYLATLGGESLPRVRASDGRVWPYRG